MVQEVTSEALSNYTIPKKDGKKAIKDMAFGLEKPKKPETPKNALQMLLAPSGAGLLETLGTTASSLVAVVKF